MLNPDEPVDSYSKKIETPIYEPKGDKPDVSALFNSVFADELMNKINHSELDFDEKTFLLRAACRHIVFDYHQIAEYYCHASPEMKKFMEESALVIIDFDKAVELGYVEMSQKLVDIYEDSYSDDEE